MDVGIKNSDLVIDDSRAFSRRKKVYAYLTLSMGFGLSPEQPAIGVILSEAMNYLSAGMWWVAFFPGLLLVIIVRMFDLIGEQVRCLILPDKAQE